MKLKDVVTAVEGIVLTEENDMEHEIIGSGAADLMSDVLASLQPDALLITGLCNAQVIRTSLIADIKAIILVRNKKPNMDTIDLANQEGITLISTCLGMFECCGRLFKFGIKCFENPVTKNNCETT